jgi:predicted DCC family thiol-disulfide oxidoreductase YuxK
MRPDASEKVRVIYDGDCPFCAGYVRFTRLRKNLPNVELVDARENLPLAAQLRNDGYDLNQGMIVQLGERIYFGDEAMHVLSLLSTRAGPFNAFMAFLFRSPRRARFVYPLLRAGRNLTLRLMGRKAIETGSHSGAA